MTASTAAAILAAGALASSLAAQVPDSAAKWFEDFEKKFPPTRKNAAAEELEKLALLLGIESRPGDQKADHPSAQDEEAYRQAGVASWLETQVKTSDDSIGGVPPPLAAYLENRQATLSRIVGLLRRETPDWGFDPRAKRTEYDELGFVQRLDRVLLAAALSEERAGRWREANDLHDASLSLSTSCERRPELIAQLVTVAVEKLEIGALRKLSEPPLGWAERMDSRERWRQFVDALEDDPLLAREQEGMAPRSSAWRSGWRSVWDAVRSLSACECSRLSAEALARPLKEELERAGEATQEPGLAVTLDNFVRALRRGARVAVDRELTSKILAIRWERTASRDSRWPVKFFDLDSRVCPGATYDYAVQGGTMKIRFTGAIETPEEPALVLPLSFQAKDTRPTPTPTRTPTLRRPLTRPTPGRSLPEG